MPEETTHIVGPGETLASIAHRYGFSDWKTIYDHPKNKDFKQKRQNPNVILSGDQVVIPKKEVKEESVDTEKPFSVTIARQTPILQIVFNDVAGNAYGNMKYTLRIGERELQGETDAKGKAVVELTPDVQEVTVTLAGDEKKTVPVPTWRLKVGALDPVEEISGQEMRLNNLGYDAGDMRTVDYPRFLSAVEEFQCDQKLKVDGICGPKTQSKLKEIHGC